MSRSIYLDYAAATPLDDDVLKAMTPYFREGFYNPSATYGAGQAAKQALDQARATVAQVIGARPSEIIFTAGGTESANLAIHGIMQQFPESEMIISAVEHDAVIRPSEQYATAVLPVDSDGRIDIDALPPLVNDKTVLVSVMYANNEVGTVQPIRKISQYIASVRLARKKAGNTVPLYLHTDACQAGNYLDLHVSRLGVDMMTLNGGKIYGPKQSGVLYIGSHVTLRPQILGGGQERGMRSGTENVAGAVGFAVALEQAQRRRNEMVIHMQSLREYFIELLRHQIPSVIVNSPQKMVLPNTVHVSFPGSDNERLLFALDEKGIMAAAGSACSASSDEPSHVLRAMNISDVDAQSSIRFTMGRDTTKESLGVVVKSLAELLSTSVY